MVKDIHTNRKDIIGNLQTLAEGALAHLRVVAAAQRPERAKKVDTSEQVLGVRTPEIRSVSKYLSAQIKGGSAQDAVGLAHALLDMRIFEARQIAYEILGNHRDAIASLGLDDLERLGEGLDNWTSVDVFAGQVAGPAWRDSQISDTDVARWAHSSDRWWRRCAVVCTVALNQSARGGTGDSDRTLMICRTVVDDRDDMVVKALSWALRELIPYDRAAVVRILEEHRDRLAGRVLREVRSKLETGLKNPKP